MIAIHERCSYKIKHGPFEDCITMKGGIRQGCALSPSLYTIFTMWFFDQLSAITSPEWASALWLSLSVSVCLCLCLCLSACLSNCLSVSFLQSVCQPYTSICQQKCPDRPPDPVRAGTPPEHVDALSHSAFSNVADNESLRCPPPTLNPTRDALSCLPAPPLLAGRSDGGVGHHSRLLPTSKS